MRWMKSAFADGRITLLEVNQRIAAWLGHAVNATSDGLILKLLPEFQWFQDHPFARPE
jgi:hypothetical protein